MNLDLTLRLKLKDRRAWGVALSRRFLNGTILFSSISPDYEKNLKDELFGCFKHIGISFEVLNKMPVRDRKYYIMKHNEEVKRQNEEYNRMSKGTKTTYDINQFTDMSQQAAEYQR